MMRTVGILGGGQLARMLAMAAVPLGVRVLVLDTSGDACAGEVATLIEADYTDEAALAEFADLVDVVTFDFENVPASSAEWLAQRVPVFPNPGALATVQDRLSEKTLFSDLGLATPEFAAVDTREDLEAAVARIGLPAVLKTRRLGYDGKGQARLRQAADLDIGWQALGAGRVPLILEAFVPFQRELSVVAVRSREGELRTWPLTRNWHENGILSLSVSPIPVDDDLADQATRFARRVAERLDYVGVFALELFEHDGRLLGNEMAPRVHNSGHWTIEGAHSSQFENHLRAVLGLPLGDTAGRGASAMLNFIGQLPDLATALTIPGLHWHDYGKQPREGRKVGHATLCTQDLRSLHRRLGEAASAFAHPAWAPAATELGL
ncbi:5-(carboxyamino)imidazole ribonucleotide synthase [Pseudofulvimonas gallinarii]|jgi:5-(carboxyamino)imidazole ribonucleotide synthase|uniref:N5-carboxyaminoimidazole ribonucleotide synthase n=2 Tax=Pseudofulvimonas gallinarii TaxID=634155 RepID=A0A4R3LHR9_9GAMM|nr:5-(carboxyamino)imidazole ribonucleotide synthase [Pseudofulvimonas gallinarii]THD15240.1 5-(carboxyamino)imidazole ribonucleotide synthase [Pseudofulvimonas gallinarii]